MLTRMGSALFRFFTSFALVCVVLVLLLLLTFIGTLEQTRHGLFDVQKKYFESLFLVHRVGGVVPVPLPGGALLMAILAVNLTLGGIVRLRKSRSRAGILLGHAGILMLLVGALVKFALAVDGQMTLFEGEGASYFETYYDWEVTVNEAAPAGSEAREWVLPLAAADLRHPDRRLTFVSGELPFDVTLTQLRRNSRPRAWTPVAAAHQDGGVLGGPSAAAASTAIDGVYLETVAPSPEAERDVAGARLAARSRATGAVHEGLLWGLQRHPLVLEIDGRAWAFDLHHRRLDLPFAVRLDRFTHETHPGTQIASTFSSDVTRFEGGAPQAVHISMNEPMRHRGYTFYQASWGPQGAGPGDPVFSTFAVAKNPADRWPLYSCIVIAAGLVMHFSSKLTRHLRSEARRAA